MYSCEARVARVATGDLKIPVNVEVGEIGSFIQKAFF